MERLTHWNGTKYILPQGRGVWREIADRLAIYEDLDEQERLFRGLCNLGSTIKLFNKSMEVYDIVEVVGLCFKEEGNYVELCYSDGTHVTLPEKDLIEKGVFPNRNEPHWVVANQYIKCSECDSDVETFTPYCPFCGVKIIGETVYL